MLLLFLAPSDRKNIVGELYRCVMQNSYYFNHKSSMYYNKKVDYKKDA
jgi:hypothetical protein